MISIGCFALIVLACVIGNVIAELIIFPWCAKRYEEYRYLQTHENDDLDITKDIIMLSIFWKCWIFIRGFIMKCWTFIRYFIENRIIRRRYRNTAK